MTTNKIALHKFVNWYETQDLHSHHRLHEIYATNIYFKDVFYEIRGLETLTLYFATQSKMYKNFQFKVTHTILEDSDALIMWDLTFTKFFMNKKVSGAFQIKFNSSGLVDYHVDHFDSGKYFYELIPILSPCLRLILWLLKPKF